MSNYGVFPTLVGVFLVQGSFRPAQACLPHARGGVSRLDVCHVNRTASSPRSWGCFSSFAAFTALPLVFPTLVGVFLQELSFVAEQSGSSPRSWGCF